VLVFTRTLQEFLISGGSQYKFPISKISTLMKWEMTLLPQYGMAPSRDGDFDEQRRENLDKLHRVVSERKLRPLYDAVLLDESQDYLPEEIALFRRLGTVIFAVADVRQMIYNGRDPLDSLRDGTITECALTHHYRNGRAICAVADAVANDSEDYTPLLGTCNYNEQARPSSVDYYRCADIDEQAERIIARLDTQLKAYPDELLMVLCPRREEVARVAEHIRDSALADVATVQATDENIVFASDKHVVVCTIHAAKGLEARAVHVAGCEFLNRFATQKRLVFTAITRAKTSLSLYYSADIPGYLDAALKRLEPLPDLPAIKDTFGRKR
jgi:superfamily I DNA/RNA helicase